MAFVKSRRPLDCVIVAIANYFGRPYKEVESALNTAALDQRGIWDRRYTMQEYLPLFARYKGEPTIYETDGRFESETGIIRFVYRGLECGHLAVLIDGHVFDRDAAGIPLAEYLKMNTDLEPANVWN